MIPLIILLLTFISAFLANHFFLSDKLSISFMGKMSMAIMLVFTGLAHFFQTDVMIQMMPEFVPFKKGLVLATGIFELLAAFGLVHKGISKRTSIGLVLFYLAVLPANIIGSLKHVPLGGMENGLSYLLFRIPLQLFFIWWCYYFGIKQTQPRSEVPYGHS